MQLINESYQIKINKYRKDDLVIRDEGIWFIGVDKSASDLRVPKLPNKKFWVKANQIAEAGDYIYIPDDQIRIRDDKIFEFPKMIASEVMQKARWGNIKEKYRFKGSIK